MRQPSASMTATMPTCALCGDAFMPIPNRRDYCTASCARNHAYRDPEPHAADLEASSVEFVAALLIDSGYIEAMLTEASVILARQGRLPVRAAA